MILSGLRLIICLRSKTGMTGLRAVCPVVSGLGVQAESRDRLRGVGNEWLEECSVDIRAAAFAGNRPEVIGQHAVSPANGEWNDRLNVRGVPLRVRRADAEIPIVLDGHANDAVDRVGRFIGQFGGSGLFVVNHRAASALGFSGSGCQSE